MSISGTRISSASVTGCWAGGGGAVVGWSIGGGSIGLGYWWTGGVG